MYKAFDRAERCAGSLPTFISPRHISDIRLCCDSNGYFYWCNTLDSPTKEVEL